MIRGAVALAATIALCACAETTVDLPGATMAADAGSTATTVFAPAGAADALLPELLAEMDGLSERIVENDGDESALARVDALWLVIRPQIEEQRLELLGSFDAAIELAHTAVERRRPADADKARNNLVALAEAFAGR